MGTRAIFTNVLIDNTKVVFQTVGKLGVIEVPTVFLYLKIEESKAVRIILEAFIMNLFTFNL